MLFTTNSCILPADAPPRDAKELANTINNLRKTLTDEADKIYVAEWAARWLLTARNPTSQGIANVVNGLAQLKLRPQQLRSVHRVIGAWLTKWLPQLTHSDAAHLANTVNGLAQLRLPRRDVAALQDVLTAWITTWMPRVTSVTAIDLANTLNGIVQLNLDHAHMQHIRPHVVPWVTRWLGNAVNPSPLAVANTVNPLSKMQLAWDDEAQEALLRWVQAALQGSQTPQAAQLGLILNGLGDLPWAPERRERLRVGLAAWVERYEPQLVGRTLAWRDGVIIYRSLFFWRLSQVENWRSFLHGSPHAPASICRPSQWEVEVQQEIQAFFLAQTGQACQIATQVNLADYRIDIVAQPGPGRKGVAIECCGRDFHAEIEPVRDCFIASHYHLVKIWSDEWADNASRLSDTVKKRLTATL